MSAPELLAIGVSLILYGGWINRAKGSGSSRPRVRHYRRRH